jgi:Flp pilus assembly pilin Flp
MAECALTLALVAFVVVAVVVALGPAVAKLYSDIISTLPL